MFSQWFRRKPAPSSAETDGEVDLARLVGELKQGPWKLLSEHERVLLAVWDLEAEVNNGGFDQYFRNSAGERAPFAIEALDAIGAPNCAEIAGRAVHLVLGEACDWDTARSLFVTASPALDGALEALDQEFYLYPDDLEARLREFVRNVS